MLGRCNLTAAEEAMVLQAVNKARETVNQQLHENLISGMELHKVNELMLQDSEFFMNRTGQQSISIFSALLDILGAFSGVLTALGINIGGAFQRVLARYRRSRI